MGMILTPKSANQKIFKDMVSLENHLRSKCRIALQNTLDIMIKQLRDIIKQKVYGSYEPSFYKRTYVLLDERTIEPYIWNNFGNSIGGGIRYNDNPYYYEYSNLDTFTHGNNYTGELAFTSYIEIMSNYSFLLKPNVFNFPYKLNRGSFYDDFVIWANENFKPIYERCLKQAEGGKLTVTSPKEQEHPVGRLSSVRAVSPNLDQEDSFFKMASVIEV